MQSAGRHVRNTTHSATSRAKMLRQCKEEHTVRAQPLSVSRAARVPFLPHTAATMPPDPFQDMTIGLGEHSIFDDKFSFGEDPHTGWSAVLNG